LLLYGVESFWDLRIKGRHPNLLETLRNNLVLSRVQVTI